MFYANMVPGIFLARPNRFIAHVEIDGHTEIVHVKNTGRCRELLPAGAQVWCQRSDNPARKTKYDLITVRKGELLINMDSQAPNIAAEEWLRSGGLGEIENLRRETVHGDSRFDLSFVKDGRQCFLEVKGVTLENGGVCAFPDAPTERGAKHLRGLLRAAQEGDKEACEQAVIENNGLIWSVVRRYYGRGVDSDDLYQLGCLGFLKAIQGFDFDYGTCFSTYAVPKIAGEIRRFLRDDGAVKVGRNTREQAQMLYSKREQLRHELGREPVLSELAEATGITPEDIAQIELATNAPESLQQEMADGLTLENTLGTDAPEEGLVERIALREAIDRLPEKERMTILLRYFKSLTQEQTARILGVSQVQVSRLERRGLERLRESFGT